MFRTVPLSIISSFSLHTQQWCMSYSLRAGSGRNSSQILTIKPTRCTNFSNLFLELNSTCFGQFLCPSSAVFHYTHSNGICHTGLLTACEQDQDGTGLVLLRILLASRQNNLVCKHRITLYRQNILHFVEYYYYFNFFV